MDIAIKALECGLLLVALCIPGFLLEKSGKLPFDAKKGLALILSYVAQPAISLYSFQINAYSPSLLVNIGLVAAFSLVSIILTLLVGRLVFRRGFSATAEEKEKRVKRTYALSTAFCNCGFMGIPFLRMLLPNSPEALLYTAIYMVFFNMLIWTVGVYMMTGERKYIKVSKIFLNPPTIVLVVALPLFFTNTVFPAPVLSFVEHCQDLAAPLSMILMGIYLARMSLKNIFRSLGSYITSFIKLIIAPIIVFGISYPFIGTVGATAVLALFIVAAMPCASANIYMNDMFGSVEGSEAAVSSVLMSTILSILSVPIMIMLLNLVVNV